MPYTTRAKEAGMSYRMTRLVEAYEHHQKMKLERFYSKLDR